jgi:RimJ/RimL family protein N-acetyltransferase
LIVFDQDPRLLAFASVVLGVRFDPAQSTWISNIADDGEPLAVVVYTRFSPYNCEMSIATDGRRKWATRAFLRSCYRYPFIQLGLVRVTGVVEDGNERALRLNQALGHVEEARLKSWFGAKDGIVFRLLKSECRWI